MVAWLDRPRERTKDLSDLALIFDQALDGDDDRRWDVEHPVFQSGLDREDQGAFFIGLEAAQIAEPAHRAWIDRFRARVGDPDGEGGGGVAGAASDVGGRTTTRGLLRRAPA